MFAIKIWMAILCCFQASLQNSEVGSHIHDSGPCMQVVIWPGGAYPEMSCTIAHL